MEHLFENKQAFVVAISSFGLILLSLFLFPNMLHAATCGDNDAGTCIDQNETCDGTTLAGGGCATGTTCCLPASADNTNGGGQPIRYGFFGPITTPDGCYISFCEYLHRIFDFAIKAAILLALVVIIAGGAVYVFSVGNEQMRETGKGLIYGAISGVVIALISWSIFNVLNPYLLKCPATACTTLPGGEAPLTGSIDCTSAAQKCSISRSNDLAGLQAGGIVQRACGSVTWCYQSDNCGKGSPCVGTGSSVKISPGICHVLNAWADQGPSACNVSGSIVGTHSRCSGSCGSSKCNIASCAESPHWGGHAMDLPADTTLQQWFITHAGALGIGQVLGPAGLYNCGGGACQRFYNAGLQSAHNSHIHVSAY